MKTLRRRIQDARKTGSVDQLVIERDYAQSYVLYGLGETSELRDTLAFKGGTALKKVHFGQYRFSEDLDFSMVDGPTESDLETAIRSAITRAEQEVQEADYLNSLVARGRYHFRTEEAAEELGISPAAEELPAAFTWGRHWEIFFTKNPQPPAGSGPH